LFESFVEMRLYATQLTGSIADESDVVPSSTITIICPSAADRIGYSSREGDIPPPLNDGIILIVKNFVTELSKYDHELSFSFLP